MSRLEMAVLGGLEARRDGDLLDVGTPKQRALLAALVLARGRPVSVDGIIDHLWGDEAPAGVTGTLQAYVSQLRRVIEPDRAPRTPAAILITAAPGYALVCGDDDVDAHRFERTITRVHKRLQPLSWWDTPALDAVQLEAARAELDGVLGLWRGTPYGELGDADSAVAERTRLDGLRLVALEDRALVALALGDHATVASEVEALVSSHPLRERLWALRVVALARSGRQADALDVLRQVREVLDEELGIEPSAELRDLQTAVLRQDERLAWVAPAAGEAVVAPVDPPAPTTLSPATSAPPVPAQVAPWPMVGRDAELAALGAALADAEAGTPAFAALVGEPGIGKSRLCAELLLQARRRGLRVLVGRCSQDEGAPPLWPWQAVVEALGGDLLSLAADVGSADEGGRFRTWERVAATVRDAAPDVPTVLLLEDLHWADEATLRVLRLLLESLVDQRMLVMATWRSHPAPTGVLADVTEVFARRHALRLDLHGLPERDVRTVFEAVAERATVADEAAALLRRTDGNPFFLVELARLAGERGAQADVAGAALPSAVGDVIDRRLGRLPEETVAALRTAAVIGRRFDLSTLAVAAAVDEDDALDVVEPAQAAGLLRENGVDHYVFTHALVRDRLREGISASRTARMHAKVAGALALRPGYVSEVADHWRSAGPAHARPAWHAAVEAAGLVRSLNEYDEAATWLRSALDSQRDDPEATEEERLALLMDLIDDYRWAARLPDLVAATEEAIALARSRGDIEAVAQAAISASQDVLWRSAPPGEINEVVVGALEEALELLPPGDGELRCRVLQALALERSGVEPADRLRPLVEESLDMARRLDLACPRMGANQVAFMALWRPDTADERLVWATEALEIAHRRGYQRGAVVAGALRATVLSELGRPEEMAEQVAATRAEALRQKIWYGDLVLTSIDANWAALAGRLDDTRAAIDRMNELGDAIDHDTIAPAIAAVAATLGYWAGDTAPHVPVLASFAEAGEPLEATVGVYRWRAGDHDGGREIAADLDISHDNESSLLAWCHSAELAAYVGDAGLAAGVYPLLLPYAGRPGVIAQAFVLPPVDAYLALAAATAGQADDAARHADDALALADKWGLAAVTAWLGDLRETLAF
ncbi:AfsR/SARP family transcriptional regulator [Nocardioides humilatus]|uniref:AfsR/SARP family transcriptional regulator n=1 Tax=Nocardioides humilatus TaxID=2607660 RepID=UPI00165F4038|nr:AfsR/SARP family transcriptional regulator [Nocardioides humilatus]